jgi:glycosyltransferase involved in cell wall biosynthesis
MAKFDIIVPCYNYGRFLETCVRSVLNQSVSDVRVLIIDDASSDDSFAVGERLAREDSRVSLIAHPVNKGHIETYNEGIAWASGDYLLLLSADDFLVPGALQRAAEVMDENPDVVLTFGDCIPWFDASPAPEVAPVGTYTWSRFDLMAAICASVTNVVPTPTAIARTSVQKAVGGYRKSLPHAGDLEMWLRFAASGSVTRIDAVQAVYRKHSTAMSNAYFAEILADFRQRELAFDCFFDEYGERLGPSRGLRQTTRRALADDAFYQGVRHLRRARFKDGVRLMRYAMELDHRLRYRPPLWQLFTLPGPAGRDWVKSSLGGAASRLFRLKGGAL